MTSCPPPYRPLRGADPPHFVDREDPNDEIASGIVAASVAAYAAGPCDPRFHRLVIGGSAMGKTALLRAIGREVASRLGWVVTLHVAGRKSVPSAAFQPNYYRRFGRNGPTWGLSWRANCCRSILPSQSCRAKGPRCTGLKTWLALGRA